MLDEASVNLFIAKVVSAGGASLNGRARRKNWTLTYSTASEKQAQGERLIIRRSDQVRFEMPNDDVTGWITFIPAESNGRVVRRWPFGEENPLRVDGSRVLACSLPPLRELLGEGMGSIAYRYILYLDGNEYDDLVDENSTPVIVIRDP